MPVLLNEPGLKVLERVLEGVACNDVGVCRVYVQVRIASHSRRSNPGRRRGVLVRGESVLDLLIGLRDEIERTGIQIDRVECFDAGCGISTYWRWAPRRR